MSTLRAAVIGAGHLGKYHAQKYAMIPQVDLMAIVDIAPERAKVLAELLKTRALTDYQAILNQVDLVSIAVPTQFHHTVASKCLKAGVHVLIEKPISSTTEQARHLIKLAKQNKCVLQVGHSERFHPALQYVRNKFDKPIYIESLRLAPFQIRGTDVNVVLDLMIHDIDIILNIIDSPLRMVQPIGIPVVTRHLDIANVRLEFKNGCVANITASRVSDKPLRKMRFFYFNKYISVDFNTHTITSRRSNTESGLLPDKQLFTDNVKKFSHSDVILAEIQAFIESVHNGTPVQVTGEQALRALEVAIKVSKRLNMDWYRV